MSSSKALVIISVGVSLIFVWDIEAFAEGAVAFATSGTTWWVSGYASNHSTEPEARRAAMANCKERSHGINCSIQRTFKDSCIAIIVKNGSNSALFSVNQDVSQAAKDGLAACAPRGLGACYVADKFCDKTPIIASKTDGIPTVTLKCDDDIIEVWEETSAVRVCPETSRGIAKFSEHEAD